MLNFQYIEDLDTEYLNPRFELKETILSRNEDNVEKSSNSEEKAQEIEKSYEGVNSEGITQTLEIFLLRS